MGLMTTCPTETLRVNGEIYRAVGPVDSINGFFDWLRDYSGKIMGIRHREHVSASHLRTALFQVLSELPYVRLKEPWEFEAYFSETGDLDSANSVDEAFGGDVLYVSDKGTYLMPFQLGWLRDGDLESLRSMKLKLQQVRAE